MEWEVGGVEGDLRLLDDGFEGMGGDERDEVEALHEVYVG